jgi:hypothetical protein
VTLEQIFWAALILLFLCDVFLTVHPTLGGGLDPCGYSPLASP